jgi:hypothetical protein
VTHVLYPDVSLKWFAVCMVSAEMLNCKLQSTQAVGIEHCTLHDVMEIANGQPWQNSGQNSVFLRGSECHWWIVEFLLHKCKRMIKSKFRASNTLLSSAEYAITRKEHFSFLV